MKRFLLFYGDTYYPLGGWGDFKGSFDTESEASQALPESSPDWFQIVDSQTATLVLSR